MMADFEAVLRPGIGAMPGSVAYCAGADEATFSPHDTSVWDTFQPVLDSAKHVAAEGITFERPIMNHAALWQIGSSASAA